MNSFMEKIRFIALHEVSEESLIELMAHPLVGQHMPLLADGFDVESFLVAKQALWDEHGYGPWAFVIDGRFAGWGGLQYENGDPDFALVLHPDYWGWGIRIFRKVRDEAFNELGLNYMTALLPPGRSNSSALLRLGFVPDGEQKVGGQVFLKFRLEKQQ